MSISTPLQLSVRRALVKALTPAIFSSILFTSPLSHADAFGDYIWGSDSWLFSKTKETALENIEKKVNERFNEKVVQKLAEIAEERLDKVVGAAINMVFGGLPVFDIAKSFIGSSGPSETQIMMQILLTAINDSKTEIIDAIEQNFQDETESSLNALVGDVSEFYARDEAYRRAEYGVLHSAISRSWHIKKRLEQKSKRAVDNSHLYILISAMHMEIQKHLTYYIMLNERQLPGSSLAGLSDEQFQAAFEQEYKNVFRVALLDNLSYLVEGELGSLSTWNEAFKKSFDKTVEYVGLVPAAEIPNISYSGTWHYFSYKMNDAPVLFQVNFRPCSTGRINTGDNYVYDPVGRLASVFKEQCRYRSDGARMSSIIEGKINNIFELHKSDSASFDKYLNEGFYPLKSIFDSWWTYMTPNDRVKSEVDAYLEAGFPEIYPDACDASGKIGLVVANGGRTNQDMTGVAVERCYPCAFSTRKGQGWNGDSYYCTAN